MFSITESYLKQFDSLASSNNPNANEVIVLADRYKQELRGVSTELQDVMQDWSILAPPEQALRYHKVAFEMMQQRYNGLQLTIVGLGMLARGQTESFVKTSNEAADFVDQSDRLYLDVLAEARNLGNVEVTQSK
jgi:hypothetical protein